MSGSESDLNRDSAPDSAREKDLEAGTLINSGTYSLLVDPQSEPPVGTTSKVKHAVAAVCERIKLEHRYIGYSLEVSKLAFPVLAAMIASALSDAIIQRYIDQAKSTEGSAEDLAAATQWISIFKLIQNAIAAPLGALYSLLSQKLGEMTWKGRAIAERSLFQLAQVGLIYAAVSSFLLMIPFYFSGDILRVCFGESRAIDLIDQKFLRFYIWGLLPFSLAAAFRPYLCVLEQRIWVTLLNVASVGVTYGFAHAFSKGVFGEEYSGLKGLSLTMTLRSVFMTVACAVLIAFARPSPKAKNQKEELVQLPQLPLYKIILPLCGGLQSSMREFFKVGLPLILKVLVEFCSSFCNSKLFSLIRTEALTVDSVVNSVLTWMMLCSSAFASAASQKVGFEKGVKNFKAAYAYGNTAIMISVMFALIACFVSYFQVMNLSKIFLAQKALDNPIVSHWLPTLMLLGVISQVFDALRITASSAYQGLMGKEGGSFWPMVWSSVGILIVGCTSSVAMKFSSPWGVYGVAAGGIAGDFTAGALCLGLWLRKAIMEVKAHGGLPVEGSGVLRRHTRQVQDGQSVGSDMTSDNPAMALVAGQGSLPTSPLLAPATASEAAPAPAVSPRSGALVFGQSGLYPVLPHLAPTPASSPSHPPAGSPGPGEV